MGHEISSTKCLLHDNHVLKSLYFLGFFKYLEVDIMRDGMTSEEISADLVLMGSGIASVVLSGADLAVASAKISATELAASSVGTDEQAFVGTGSPPTYAGRILYGSTAIPATTSIWVAFGDKFGAVPNVVIGENSAITITAVTVGSFLASGANASIAHWLAIGSK